MYVHIHSNALRITQLFVGLNFVTTKEKKKAESYLDGREDTREWGWCIMYMGMVLTRAHCYVAGFGLSLGPLACHSPVSVHTLPGPCSGASPTGHGAQTPWWPLFPQPMHCCKHPQIRRTNTHNMGMRDETGWEGAEGGIQSQARGLENETDMRD